MTTSTLKTITSLRKRYVLAFCAAVLTSVMVLGGCARAEKAANDTARAGARAADSLPGIGEPSHEATLTGQAEVPGPGDPNGSGEADVRLDAEDGEVCYDIDVEGVDPITMAHIHRGGPGEAGPPVVDLNVPANGLDGCVTATDRAIVQAIISNPGGFYVNVHNQPFPAGALRGQLRD